MSDPYATRDAWYVKIGDHVFGPYPFERVAGFVIEGRVRANTLVACGDPSDLAPAEMFADLADWLDAPGVSGDAAVEDPPAAPPRDEPVERAAPPFSGGRREPARLAAPERSWEAAPRRDAPPLNNHETFNLSDALREPDDASRRPATRDERPSARAPERPPATLARRDDRPRDLARRPAPPAEPAPPPWPNEDASSHGASEGMGAISDTVLNGLYAEDDGDRRAEGVARPKRGPFAAGPRRESRQDPSAAPSFDDRAYDRALPRLETPAPRREALTPAAPTRAAPPPRAREPEPAPLSDLKPLTFLNPTAVQGFTSSSLNLDRLPDRTERAAPPAPRSNGRAPERALASRPAPSERPPEPSPRQRSAGLNGERRMAPPERDAGLRAAREPHTHRNGTDFRLNPSGNRAMAGDADTRVFLIVCPGSERDDDLAEALDTVGRGVRAARGVWFVTAEGSADGMRNALTRRLSRPTALIVAEASAETTAWFNLGSGCDRAVRALLEDQDTPAAMRSPSGSMRSSSAT